MERGRRVEEKNKFLEQTPVLENQSLAPGVFRLVLKAPQMAAHCVPGQFVMVRLNTMADPLLRRPISIAGADPLKGTLTLIVRIVGRGTRTFESLQTGASLSIMGPLGRGFDLSGERLLLVGGGIGLAPLLFAAERCCPRPVEVIAGGKTGDELFWAALFEQSCNRVHVTTDDGSLGFCGTCADALPEILINGNYDRVLTCGPRPMMKRVAEEAAKAGIRTQVSLEEHMACGLGACLTCTCQDREGGSRQICKDGPIFWAEEVKWT